MITSEFSLLKAAFWQSWNAIVVTEADRSTGYRVVAANPAFCAMTGYSLDELRGGTLKCLQGEDTDPLVIDSLRECLREARFFDGTTVNYRKDGSPYVVHWNISPVRDENGVLTHFVSIQQDISETVQMAQENQLLARALDATSDSVVVTDAKARITFANNAFFQLTGYGPSEVLGKTPAMLRSGQHDEAFYAELNTTIKAGRAFRATFTNRRRDGTLYHAEQSISPIIDEKGRITHYISVSKDISERVLKEQSLQHEASHDPLTGLLNRRTGEQAVSAAVLAAHTTGRPLTLMMCDIDHFKQVNDQFGHTAGDRVIREVAQILRQALRGGDVVARWGGEEFLVLLDNCAQTQAMALAERICQRVAMHRDSDAGIVTVSLGIAALTSNEAVDELIARADNALYGSKHGGRNQWTVAG